MEFERIKGSELQGLCHQKLDVNPINIAGSSSHEDYEDRGLRGRRGLGDDLNDIKNVILDFDGNLKLENYIDWIQNIKRII